MSRAMPPLKLKRVYDAASPVDGTRILVDRLWPRGITREKARIDLWRKEISPSDALRKRFHASPDDWELFRTAYAQELAGAAARNAIEELARLRRLGPVTLLYAAKDEQKNNAVALKLWIEAQESSDESR